MFVPHKYLDLVELSAATGKQDLEQAEAELRQSAHNSMYFFFNTPQHHDFGHIASFVNKSLHMRIVTSSERNLIRLRIWLGYRLYKTFGSSGICRFGPRTVVKYTPTTRVAEAANMEFIASHTQIPLPRVHDVFIIGSRTYIVMDYIDAPELTFTWHKLTNMQKKQFFVQLKDYINQMRALEPSNPGHIQAADGTGVFDSRLCLDNCPMGPFISSREFHTHLGHDCIRTLKTHQQYWPLLDKMAEKQYRTVFSHSDISPRNVLARDGKILGIIDWECAGWYPEYWEYTRWLVSNYRSSLMWAEERDKIMDVYADELEIEDYLGSVYTRL